MTLLILVFILVPIIELWVILQVGGAIGVLPTIALLIADSIAGAWLLRHQGRQAWRAFNATLAEGRVPGRETADGALIIFGGALLMTPGFVTDIAGLLFLLPPTRALIRRLLIRRGVRVGAAAFGPAGSFTVRTAQWGAGARGRSRKSRSYDVDSTATEVGDEPPARPSLP